MRRYKFDLSTQTHSSALQGEEAPYAWHRPRVRWSRHKGGNVSNQLCRIVLTDAVQHDVLSSRQVVWAYAAPICDNHLGLSSRKPIKKQLCGCPSSVLPNRTCHSPKCALPPVHPAACILHRDHYDRPSTRTSQVNSDPLLKQFLCLGVVLDQAIKHLLEHRLLSLG